MSEGNQYEDVKAVSRDGVTVERELLCTDAGIRGTFRINSRRDGPVRVRLVDELPTYFPIDDVAFRPGEAPEDGTISEGQVSVAQTVADEAVQVQYGIVPSEPVAEVRWSAPMIEGVEPAGSPETEESADDAEGSAGPIAPLQGLFDGEADSTAGTVDGELQTDGQGPDSHGPDGYGPDSHGPDAHDPDDTTSRRMAGEHSPAASDGSAAANAHQDVNTQPDADQQPDADGGSADPTAESTERHVDTVDTTESEATVDEVGGTAGNETGETPAELTRGDTADEAASEVSNGEGNVARRFEVRLDRLTARVEKFGAYASALEPLIDERGTGETVIDGIERDLDDLDQRLDAVRTEVESVREEREDTFAEVHESVDRIDEALDDVEVEVGTLEAAVDGLEGGLGDAEQDLNSLEDRVDGHDAAIDGVESDLRALEDRVDGFESDLADLRESVEGVEAELATVSETAQSVAAELDAIHEEVETLHDFRKSLAQISNVDN